MYKYVSDILQCIAFMLGVYICCIQFIHVLHWDHSSVLCKLFLQHANFVQTTIHNRTGPVVLRCSSNEILRKWCNAVVYLKHVAGRWDDGVVVDSSVWHVWNMKWVSMWQRWCDIHLLLRSTYMYQSQSTGSGERLSGWE